MVSQRRKNTGTKRSGRTAARGTEKKATTRVPAAAVKQWTFPKNTLEEALAIPKAIDQKHAGKPVRAADLVKMVGFRKPTDWRFLDLLRSANQYGLVEGSGATATVKLAKVGQDIVAPSSRDQRKAALLGAFRAVAPFAKVLEHYHDGRFPEDEYFANTLVRDFGVERDRVTIFIKVFTENARYVKTFVRDRRTRSSETCTASDEVEAADPSGPEDEVRQFLDTCFVLMPFGGDGSTDITRRFTSPPPRKQVTSQLGPTAYLTLAP